MQTVLKANEISKEVATYDGNFQILSSLSLELKAAESLSIVGASGSGKSTLLGLLAGLDVPTAGRITLLDHELTELDEDGRARLRAGRVGFVFQSFHLFPTLNALENVASPLDLLGFSDARSKATDALDQVGLSHRLHHYPAQLSGGEQQRVAIARAFVTKPEILFADEPTGNLDKVNGDKIAELLFDLQVHYGTALVLATHDLKLSARCGDQYTMD